MFEYTDNTGKLLDRDTFRGLKVRLGHVFKRSGQTMTEFMAELKLLSSKDEQDFRDWFNQDGYPTT